VVPAKRTMQRSESLEVEICERLANEKQFSAMVPMQRTRRSDGVGLPMQKRKERDSVRIAATANGLHVKPSEVLP
jgi:hypothetical protein